MRLPGSKKFKRQATDSSTLSNGTGGPSETSPLLAKGKRTFSWPKRSKSDSAAIVTAAAGSNGNGRAVDGGDVERQVTNEGRPKQYEGLPEVKKRMRYIFPAIAVGVFLAAADQTLIVSSYGTIGTDLQALNKTSWIATAYFLTLTSFQPLYGKLSDIFGRKSCLLFAYVIFGLGCLWCGLARDINELIIARAFAGIGGGGMTTVVSITLSDVVTLRERGKWQGYVNIVYATGAATGAPLGGIAADYIGWRWAFLCQAPVCLLAFVAVLCALHLPKRDESHWKSKLLRIDFLGAFILVTAVFTLLLGLDRGSNFSWNDQITIASLGASLPLCILFIIVEMKVASNPFAPGHIIFDRSMVACYLCNFFAFSGWMAALFYIPLYFQAVDSFTATEAGLRLIPAIVCSVTGSLSGGVYMQKTGHYYWITVIAYFLLVAGLAAVFLFSGFIVTSLPGIIAGMCVCAFGSGVGVTTSLIGLIANASHEDQAVATACSYLFRSLGSVFGVAMSATIANQTLRQGLESKLSNGDDAKEIAEKVRESLNYIKTLEPEVRKIVRDCYAVSCRNAFGVQVALVVGAAISAWFIREKKLSH